MGVLEEDEASGKRAYRAIGAQDRHILRGAIYPPGVGRDGCMKAFPMPSAVGFGHDQV
jgi:hypothetical protein